MVRGQKSGARSTRGSSRVMQASGQGASSGIMAQRKEAAVHSMLAQAALADLVASRAESRKGQVALPVAGTCLSRDNELWTRIPYARIAGGRRNASYS